MTDATSGANSPKPIPGAKPKNCPKCGRESHDKKYRRSKAERKKALLRDATDPKSGLSASARKFIIRTKGDKVPSGYQVSHEVPLATVPKKDRCDLDTADNMKTQPTKEHRQRHMVCGDQYHDFGPLG